jgi:hypothetical protein
MYTRTAFVPQEVRAEAAVPVRTRRNGHLFPRRVPPPVPEYWRTRCANAARGILGIGGLGHGCGLFDESGFSAAPEAIGVGPTMTAMGFGVLK